MNTLLILLPTKERNTMSKITLTPGSKKFKLLVWMMNRPYTAYGEIQRFLCELNDLDYDQMTTENVWKKAPVGSDRNYVKAGTKQVRMHRGIWATNLSSGRDPILRNYCERIYSGGKYLGWAVKPLVAMQLHVKLKAEGHKSSLEATFPSDEIPNNSKVVERKVIRMTVDGKDVGWKPGDNGFAGDTAWVPMTPSVKEALDKLTIRPTTPREALLDAARLAPKVSPLVALQEKFELIKKERQELWDKQDVINERLVEIENELERVRGEVNKMFDSE